jgi:hypothetical protein
MTTHAPPSALTDCAPVVPVRRRGHTLIVERCPYCGRRHVHGDAGRRERGEHGHRLAHCRERTAGNPGYVLVETAAPRAFQRARPLAKAPARDGRA